MEKHFMNPSSADYLRDYLQLQMNVSHCKLPGRHRLVIEHFSDSLNTNDSKQVVIHTFWGGRINTPYAFALAAAWKQKYGYKIQVFNDDDSILLDLPHDFNDRDLIFLVTSGNIEKLLRMHLDFLKERVFIPLSEWTNLLYLCDLVQTDGLNEKITRILPEGASEASMLALENSTYEDLVHKRDDPLKLINLLIQFLSYYGPVEFTFLRNLFGDAIVNWLRDGIDDFEGRIIIVNRPNSESLICETESLEILLRMKRRKDRSSFKPLSLDNYPLFLADYQGLVHKKEGIGGLKEILNTLFGYSLKSSLWESDVIPARVADYHLSWLDTVLGSEGLQWYGCGTNRTSFFLQGDEELFINPEGEMQSGIFPDARGRYRFWDLQEFSKIGSEELSRILWEEVWNGHVSTDSWEPVRRANLIGVSKYPDRSSRDNSHRQKRRAGRSSFARWKSRKPDAGSWYIIDNPQAVDLIDERERKEERVRQLLLRYGILFREILQREQPGFRWKDLFPVLRYMELSGELTGGCFFEGIPGLQFASPSVLSTLTKLPSENNIFMLNAADPASLCGLDIETLKKNLPSRLSTTHLVYKGSKLLLVSRSLGKRLEFRVSEESPDIPEAIDQLKNLILWGIITSLRVGEVNGSDVFDSPYLDALKNSGFTAELKFLVFRGNIRNI